MKMFMRCVLFLSLLATAHSALAQGIMGDVFSGKLINPEVGVFAWYDLTDTSTGKQFYLRLAIVGEEKIKGKTGHWFEVELVPRVGFPAVYKLLLTGPASDPKNVHRIMMKEGNTEAVELDTASLSEGSQQSASADRNVVGSDTVETQAGSITAEHVVVEKDGVSTDIWLNNEVRPMGLVKMKNAQGELILRNYGNGGDMTRSMFDNPMPNGVIDVPANTIPTENDMAETVSEESEEQVEEITETEMETAPAETPVEGITTPSPTAEPSGEAAEDVTEDAAASDQEKNEEDSGNNKRNTPRTQRRGAGGKR